VDRHVGWEAVSVVAELRAEHLELLPEMGPVRVIYFALSHEAAGVTVPPSAQQRNLWQAARDLSRPELRCLELPEPLFLRMVPRLLTLVAAVRLRPLLGRSRVSVRAYAIENNDLTNLLQGLPRLARLLAALLLRFLTARFDELVFGSTGARDTYATLSPRLGPHRVMLDLPSPSPSHVAVAQPGVVFVGEVSPRKGLPELMRAWETVEFSCLEAPGSSWTLTIVGDGDLAPRVQEWAARNPVRRVYLGRRTHREVQELLAMNTVLAAPSMRVGRWREQIGLSIREALSQGLTVVTTDETGLADWLTEHGHWVVNARDESERLSTALMEALASPLDSYQVRASLPTVDSRLQIWRRLLGRDEAQAHD
jgi:glycosyltransferase involved in cell wall biosynthesis